MAPFDEEELYRLKMENLGKEVMACIERRYIPYFDHLSYLSPDYKDRIYSNFSNDWITPGKGMFHTIYSKLSRTIPKIQGLTIYPLCGSKTVGKVTSEEYRVMARSTFGDSYECSVSTTDLEYLYSRTGYKCSGPTEIRQAFKFNDIRPRIYFARGGQHYFGSRFIQPVLNIVIDSIEACHRKERFNIRQIRLTRDGVLVTYDFSQFTSRLDTVRGFLFGLAGFYEDVFVTVIDSFHGPINISVKEIILEYIYECNLDALFSIAENLIPGGSALLFEASSGLLGIPGNITSSTLWHAIYIMILLMILGLKVVGDDALIPVGCATDLSKEEVIETVNEIGTVALSKTESWDEPDEYIEDYSAEIWNYVKRPLFRLQDRAIDGVDPMWWPSLHIFLTKSPDRYHTFNPPGSTFELHRKSASSLFRFCREVIGHYQDEDEFVFASDFLKMCLRLSGLTLFDEETRTMKRSSPSLIRPGNIWHGDYNILIDDCIGLVFGIPDWEEDDEELKIGSEVKRRGSKSLSFGYKMGWVSKRSPGQKQILVCEDNRELISKFLKHDLIPSYLFEILPCCPSWFLPYLSSDITPDTFEIDELEDVTWLND
jgi:hypothetical protein